MECADARILIHGHLDGELELSRDLEVEQHLENCPSCADQYAEMRALRSALRRGELRYPAPAELESRIRAALRQERPRDAPRMRRWPRSLEVTIPLAVAAVLALVVVPRAWSPSENQMLAQEVVASHVRSLIGTHLYDVESTDRHTVKPWFEGKIDYSPPVADFAAQGFALVGGRVDYLAGRSVASLVYRHGKHVINAFVWPNTSETRPTGESSEHGFNVLSFDNSGMTWWLVSDIAPADLQKLAELIRG